MARKATEEAPILEDFINNASVAQAAKELKVTEQRVRQLCNEGVLKEAFRARTPGHKIVTWWIPWETVHAYKARRQNMGGYTGSGVNKTPGRVWEVYLTWPQLDELSPIFEKLGITLKPRYKYDPKRDKARRDGLRVRDQKNKNATDE